MGSVGATKVILQILNTIITILGLGLAATSIWFYVELTQFTSLRNSNHYLLDYKVYWPQAIPWMFFVVAILVICVAICGFTSARKDSKGFIMMYVFFNVFVIVALVAGAVVALVFADSKTTEDFIKDTVWDVYFQSKADHSVGEAYGVIERKLHCCGADSPRDYKNWKTEFPQSCCDTLYHGWLDAYAIDCQFTNKLANERYGCSTVASEYARIIIKALSGASALIAFLGILCIVVAITLQKGLKKSARSSGLKLVARQDSTLESKKGLL